MAEKKAGNDRTDGAVREDQAWGIGSGQARQGTATVSGPRRSSNGVRDGDLQAVKSHIHRRLLERLNLSNLNRLDHDTVVETIRGLVRELLAADEIPLNVDERDKLVLQILDEIFGLGPLQPLMEDPTVADILVNTANTVYVERNGRLERTDVRFQSDRHLLQVIDRIVSSVGRRIDDTSPMVDARLPDGSRVNAIVPPLAIDGPHLSIRKFNEEGLSAEDLVRLGTLTEPMLQFLGMVVRARLNVLVSGGTGAGKTTMLNVLSGFIPENERVVTVEDSAELRLRQSHVVRLETRMANVEGAGAIPQRMLVVNALRMRPDRIVVGEVRSAEAIDMLQAMNTGHEGSLTTLHANSPRDALTRLETMVAMAALSLPDRAVRVQIASAIDIIIQISRLSDGSRRVKQIAEVVGMEGDVITMQEIFTFEQTGVEEDGRVIGRLRPTGIRPRCMDRLKAFGFEMSAESFAETHQAGRPEQWT
ncbi:MAG TPA: CpaF family protein [Longimicrobiales bacterium]|nr:CpaF family protein [Longimicrobiales bacterium]